MTKRVHPGVLLLAILMTVALVIVTSLPLRALLGTALVALWAAEVASGQRAAARAVAAMESYLAQMPDLPATAPALPPTWLPLAEATRHAAAGLRARLELSGASRQQLETLLEGMQDAVLGLDPSGRVEWSNGRMQQLMQRNAGGAAVRQGRPLVHTFRDPELLSVVQRTLEIAEAAECRSEAVSPGCVYQVRASPLPDGGAVLVLRDVTAAEQMERTQRDFVANVSHELRTPLTSIIGYVETVIDQEPLSPPAFGFLQTALRNASRMQRLTEDLLLISQTEQSDTAPSLQRVAVATLLDDAVRTVAGAPYAEGAELTVSSCVQADVLADPNALSQVLGNLLENAVKYSGKGVGRHAAVQLTADIVPDDVPYVRVRVRDFGPGIAQEHIERIFDRFYRVEKARSRAVGGTGLGLSIARKLIEQHGGRMWAESVLGEGSTFVFTLQLAERSAVASSVLA